MANHNTIVNIKISRLVALYININNFFYIFSNNWDQASRYRNKWQPCIPYCKYTSTFDAHLIFLSLWRQISQRKYVIGGIFYDADSRGQGGGVSSKTCIKHAGSSLAYRIRERPLRPYSPSFFGSVVVHSLPKSEFIVLEIAGTTFTRLTKNGSVWKYFGYVPMVNRYRWVVVLFCYLHLMIFCSGMTSIFV